MRLFGPQKSFLLDFLFLHANDDGGCAGMPASRSKCFYRPGFTGEYEAKGRSHQHFEVADAKRLGVCGAALLWEQVVYLAIPYLLICKHSSSSSIRLQQRMASSARSLSRSMPKSLSGKFLSMVATEPMPKIGSVDPDDMGSVTGGGTSVLKIRFFRNYF